MDVAARIHTLIQPTLDALGFDLVRLRFFSGPSATLQVMAERPDGRMSVEDCALLSRALSDLLEAEDPIPGAYRLEVSSPGIDRPLTRLKDFVAWAGAEAKLELKSPIGTRKRFRGTLTGVEGETVLIDVPDTEEKSFRIPFAEIAEARLVMSDALIALAAAKETQYEAPPHEADGRKSA